MELLYLRKGFSFGLRTSFMAGFIAILFTSAVLSLVYLYTGHEQIPVWGT